MCGRLLIALALLAGPALASAAAPNQALVNQRVAAGRVFLRAQLAASLPEGGQHEVGGHALAVLALLESGARPDDQVVAAACNVIRTKAIRETKTYHVALMLMVCDKLGGDADRSLVQSLAVRLLAGQNADGGWSYQCPSEFIDQEEQRRLATLLDRQLRAVGRRPALRPPTDNDTPAPATPPPLDEPIRRQIERVLQNTTGQFAANRGSDNSNTQFAMMGLWVARRHGVPVEAALQRVEKRFRESRDPSTGGWGYTTSRDTKPAMTCAGLLGLALAHGQHAQDVANLENDEAIKKGLLYLGDLLAPTPRGAPPASHRTDLYFLWSLERVMVAFGLDTVGDRDWYGWGAEAILAMQAPDGSWSRSYGSEVDTALALLFLGQANLARDLSAKLRGKVRDPGKVVLRAQLPAGNNPPTVAPKPEPAGDPRKLAEELVAADRPQQERLIERYGSEKGIAYTEALGLALPRLTGASEVRARDALTDRLARMNAATLRYRLKDENPEMRRSAALACGTREQREFIPDLIGVLTDRDAKVVRAARVALRHITGVDHGPEPDADAADRERAVTAWKAWWAKQAK